MKDITYSDMIQFFRGIGVEVSILDEETIPVCKCCGKRATDLEEYTIQAKEYEMNVSDYVKTYEGTYNRLTNKFYCTPCYIKVGQPIGKA